MEINSGLIRAMMLLAGFCCVSPGVSVNGKINRIVETADAAESFAPVQHGIVTGNIDTAIARYRKDVVVYLKGVQEKIIPKATTIDQKNLKFIPHVVAVPVGSTVSFVNSDKVNHDIFSAAACKKMDIDNLYPGATRTEVFDKACAINLLCDLHSEMSGYVIVVDSNHLAVTDPDGRFTIGSVPPGTYEIAVWSEKLKPQNKMTVIVKSGQTSFIDITMTK
jgi:plastocyanin